MLNTLPDDYVELLHRLAVAFEEYHRLSGHEAVLVGGAVVAIQTDGAFMSGDLDIHAPNAQAFDAGLAKAGFVPEDRSRRLRGGYYHPHFPRYGLEAVSGDLFDGRADRQRFLRLVMGEAGTLVLPSIEDIIADRLGQHCSGAVGDDAMLEQARLLFRLADDIDMDYLSRRVVEDGGNLNLLFTDRLDK